MSEGIFETIRVEDGQIFGLHRHHCRAKEAAASLGFEILSEDEVRTATEEVISKADYALARLRLKFNRSGELGIDYEPYEEPLTPAKLMIFDRRNPDFQLRFKEYPYKNYEILEFAKAQGFDDAILIAPDDQVAETSMATLALKIEGEWITPPLSAGILNGVVRALCIESDLLKVRKVLANELDKVESAMLLSSLRNAQNVGSIAGGELTIDNEKRNEIHRLMAGFKGR
jgi:branched-chain amino acid aminotransferase